MGATLLDTPDPLAVRPAIARQAILDRRDRVVGYQLVLGAGGDANPDPEQVQGTLLVEALTGIGLNHVVGRRPAHVRVTRRFLLDQHAFALPAERVVLELDAPAPDDAPLRVVLERLAQAGHRLALRVRAGAPPPDAALARLLDAVVVDVARLDGPQIDAAARRLAPAAPTLLAAGVDTPALHARCRAAGFDRFQGAFFCAPDPLRPHAPPTSRLAELRTLAGLYAPAIAFEEFERIIARDPGLSYRLIAYLNSAFFNLPRHVTSVREALMMLGMKAVRRWATLVALSADADKPHELTVTALVRGRLCELIGRRRPSPTAGPDAFFTVGIFSVVDAMTDTPLARALAALPLQEETRAALLDRAGPMGDALAAAIAWERGELAAAQRRLPGIPLGELYLHALQWADAASGALGAELDDEAAAQATDRDDAAGDAVRGGS